MLTEGPLEGAWEEILRGNPTSHTIRRFAELMAQRIIVIIDEFDRPEHRDELQQFSDTIKELSDYLVPMTLVFVGVADSVDGLIREHASIDRALTRVLMPRMAVAELVQLVETRLERVGMAIAPPAVQRIAALSQGLPHYAHLLGLHAALKAVDGRRRTVDLRDVRAALSVALDRAQQSAVRSYQQATASPRRENVFGRVLLACALAPVDDLGYFAPVDVRAPLSAVMGRPYDIPLFARPLQGLCLPERGQVLQATGEKRRQRFRFVNPLMKPYVLLRGLREGTVSEAAIDAMMTPQPPDERGNVDDQP